ncbi:MULTISPECIES: GH25 family lysozyme [unclassified Streptomyces]|uniref:GH25 family lysozyme n=1 Tax=unclassified Streptomyces TaxID=2593676 RepID=UPI000FA9721C|nr:MULTISPECIES: GH25 family lysozyme [unclassified Streptomyces]RPK53961.1 Autolytic lysozyme [Streptomyces sp. ADI95-17]
MRIISKKTGLQAGAMVAVAAAGFGLISYSGNEQAQANSPAAYGVKGFDTSHHNSHPIQWSAAARAGYSFVFQKATQGTGYRDPQFAGDFAGASRAGLMAAPYHFYDTGSGAAQADHFIRTARAAGYDGKRPGQLPPVVDLEKIRGRCPAGVNNTQIAAFLARARQAFGVNPIVYTSKDFADTCLRGNTGALANSPLWQPRYGSGTREPAPVGGRYWSIWQYTENGTVPGLRGKADINVYKGTLTQLRALAHLSPGQTPTGPGTGSTTPPAPPTTPPAPSTAVWPLLKNGTRGVNVTTAQHLLAAAGQSVTADGIYGPNTQNATAAFQRSHGLTADGIIGPNTWNKLTQTVHTGSSGSAVKAAQARLAGYGNRIAVDGAFGPATRNAAMAFQRSHGLTADGIIGPKTWNKLVNGTKTTQPAPTQPAPANGRLTQRQALTQLAAAGIKAPVGRTSLGGVRARTIQGVIALKKASGCTITITGGTESGHSAGPRSHANGYKLDLRTRDEGRCVTNWIKTTQRKGAPRGNNARWHGTLNGISAEYVYETPRSGGVHWDITFI